MTDSTNSTSFIPKRNPVKKERRNSERQVFVGTFIVKIIFFATLISAGAVFAYQAKLKSDFDSEVVALDTTISTFSEADMVRVLDANLRLKQAKQRLEHTASMVTLLEAFEKSIIDSNEVSQLSVERVSDLTYEIESEMKASSFDSVLFQRSILEKSDTLVVSKIDDLALQNIPPDNGLFDSELESKAGADKVQVAFKVLLSTDTSKIPHKAASINQLDSRVIDSMVPDVNSGSETNTTEVNQQDL